MPQPKAAVIGFQLGVRILRVYVFERFQKRAAELPDLLVSMTELPMEIGPRHLVGSARRNAPEALGEPGIDIEEIGRAHV